jgi:hypothetical protein
MRSDESVIMEGLLLGAYEKWLRFHHNRRKGDGRKRLEALTHSTRLMIKNVWWPAFRSFEDLHPEYEVKDYKDGWRYLDFAFLRHPCQIAIEIDDYGTHGERAGRWKASDHTMRQNHLVIDEWTIIRFTYQHLVEQPRVCQQILQQVIVTKLFKKDTESELLPPVEQVILKLAVSEAKPLTPMNTASNIGVHRKTAAKHLRSLADKGRLIPMQTSGHRVVRYRLPPQ